MELGNLIQKDVHVFVQNIYAIILKMFNLKNVNEIIAAVNLIFWRLRLSVLHKISQKNTFNFEGEAKWVLFSLKNLQNVLFKK